jgi:hypothetical protein
MGEISKLVWLIGLVKQAMCVDFLCSSFQSAKSWPRPNLSNDLPHKHVGHFLIFVEDPL